MSDVSDLAPLPSTPSHHGDHLDMEMPSPGGNYIVFVMSHLKLLLVCTLFWSYQWTGLELPAQLWDSKFSIIPPHPSFKWKRRHSDASKTRCAIWPQTPSSPPRCQWGKRHLKKLTLFVSKWSHFQGNLTPIREQSEGGPQLVIWGTDVVVSLCKAKFRKFINQFLPTDEENISDNMNLTEPFYLQELQQVHDFIF